MQPLSPEVRFGFQNALLGETLAAWRVTAGSGGARPTVTARSAVVTCSTPPVALGGHQIAHDIRFQFIGGRLARIRFLTSIDADDRVRAPLDGWFGAPGKIIRDNIQIDRSIETSHLETYRRNGPSTIILNDAESDGRSLSVTYRLDSVASALPTPST